MKISLSSLKTFFATGMLVFLAVLASTNVTVSALTVGTEIATETAQMKDILANMQKEVTRRLDETNKVTKELKATKGLNAETKAPILKALDENAATLKEFKKQISEVKTLAQAQELAKNIEAKYDQYAVANAQASTLKDAGAQAEAKESLEGLADEAQAAIDAGGAGGMDVSALQEQLKGLVQLIESIGAIVASVIALIMALATGNYAKAHSIFMAILGQLAQNLVSTLAAQTGLEDLISAFPTDLLNISVGENGIQFGGGNGTKAGL